MSHAPLLLALAALALPAPALALQNLEGHVTDPNHRMSGPDRERLNKKLGEIMDNTHVDVACWMSDFAPEVARAEGEAAYRRWGIGKAWDNAVFFMFPRVGPVQVILEPGRPELTPQELARVQAADDPRVDLAQRLERLADATNTIVMPKSKSVRPPGQTRPGEGRLYLLGAIAVGFCAMLLAFARRPEEQHVPVDPPKGPAPL